MKGTTHKILMTDSDGRLGQTVRHARLAGRQDAMRVFVLALLAGLTDGFAGGLTDGSQGNRPSLKRAEK